MMYMCYLDESGVPEDAGTSHFVLLGLAVIGEQWKALENQITACKNKYGLGDSEIHAAWIARRYIEQEKVQGFADLACTDRRKTAETNRKSELIRIAAHGTPKQLKDAKLNQRKTQAYIHLTRDERFQLLRELADTIAGWQDARLFAEVVDKREVYKVNRPWSPFEFSFTELVQRFEYFLGNRGKFLGKALNGLLVQDNNETVARRLTEMMRKFHREGTRWTGINHIIETPLFVDSQLTSMVQMADLCAYAVRRFFENQETDLFGRIYQRFDRASGAVVGIRHFSVPECSCKVCRDH